jgi:hypothetical protein
MCIVLVVLASYEGGSPIITEEVDQSQAVVQEAAQDEMLIEITQGKSLLHALRVAATRTQLGIQKSLSVEQASLSKNSELLESLPDQNSEVSTQSTVTPKPTEMTMPPTSEADLHTVHAKSGCTCLPPKACFCHHPNFLKDNLRMMKSSGMKMPSPMLKTTKNAPSHLTDKEEKEEAKELGFPRSTEQVGEAVHKTLQDPSIKHVEQVAALRSRLFKHVKPKPANLIGDEYTTLQPIETVDSNPPTQTGNVDATIANTGKLLATSGALLSEMKNEEQEDDRQVQETQQDLKKSLTAANEFSFASPALPLDTPNSVPTGPKVAGKLQFWKEKKLKLQRQLAQTDQAISTIETTAPTVMDATQVNAVKQTPQAQSEKTKKLPMDSKDDKKMLAAKTLRKPKKSKPPAYDGKMPPLPGMEASKKKRKEVREKKKNAAQKEKQQKLESKEKTAKEHLKSLRKWEQKKIENFQKLEKRKESKMQGAFLKKYKKISTNEAKAKALTKAKAEAKFHQAQSSVSVKAKELVHKSVKEDKWKARAKKLWGEAAEFNEHHHKEAAKKVKAKESKRKAAAKEVKRKGDREAREAARKGRKKAHEEARKQKEKRNERKKKRKENDEKEKVKEKKEKKEVKKENLKEKDHKEEVKAKKEAKEAEGKKKQKKQWPGLSHSATTPSPPPPPTESWAQKVAEAEKSLKSILEKKKKKNPLTEAEKKFATLCTDKTIPLAKQSKVQQLCSAIRLADRGITPSGKTNTAKKKGSQLLASSKVKAAKAAEAESLKAAQSLASTLPMLKKAHKAAHKLLGTAIASLSQAKASLEKAMKNGDQAKWRAALSKVHHLEAEADRAHEKVEQLDKVLSSARSAANLVEQEEAMLL